MGADIHMYVERKDTKAKYEEDNWIKIGKVFKDPYYDPEKGTDQYFTEFIDTPYTGRNYDLFALLANVRNRQNITPIAEPKRLPNNASLIVKGMAYEWQADGHSHSHFTLDELLNYNWDTPIPHFGYFKEEDYLKFKETNEFQEHCQGVGGSKVVQLTEEKYHKLKNKDPDKNYYIAVNWSWPARKSLDLKWLDTLKDYAKKENIPHNEIRIVFWFDN